MTDKYRAACVEYVAAKDEIKRLGKAIGAALEACTSARADALFKSGNFRARFSAEAKAHDDGTHLKTAYSMAQDPDSYYGVFYEHHDGDVEEYLRGVCLHCLKAHQLIQERKAARKRFGIAKRRISMLGRAEA